MRIFVTSHNTRHGGGISVARNLIRGFGQVAPGHEYFVTIPRGLGYEECCAEMPRCTYLSYEHSGVHHLAPQVRRWQWENWQLPAVARQFRPDVIFNMANRGFLDPAAPQATLIVDAHLFYPFSHFGRIGWRERIMFFYHRTHLKKSLRRTGLLFCMTKVGADRLRAFYRTEVPIQICPNHFSAYARKPGEVEMPAKLQPLRDRFKLFVLTQYYSHKNLEIIPKVFERYRRELEGVVVVLTISPEQSPQAKKLLANIRKQGLGASILTVGPLAQAELAAYYIHTDALFLPTLLELFSGTYVEAMAYGRPILTSDMDFSRAVCGEAAEYFDPVDPLSICRAILNVKNDSALRRRLVQAGKARQSEDSSWENTAQRIIAGLECLAGSVKLERLVAG
jgi:glycosyltransferase involved in cell wall biosynthesis